MIKALNILTVLCTVITMVQLTRVTMKLNDITVYDIDLVRHTFLEEAQYSFMNGCRRAVNVYATSAASNGYNVNSPMAFCNAEREKFMEYLEPVAWKLGRKPE